MAIAEANKIFRKKEHYITSKLDRLDKDINVMEKDLLNLIFGKYVGQFDVDDTGKLKPTAKNLSLARKLDKIIDQFDSQVVRKLNTKLGKDLLELTVYAKDYYSDLDIDQKTVQSISKSMTGIEQSIGIRDGEIIKGGYLDDLTRMSPLRMEMKNYVLNSVASSKGYSEYLKGWTEMIKSAPGLDGRLKSYYRQYAYDTFNQVDAAVNMHYAENLDLKYFIYAGSIISSSRQFCIKRAGKTFSVAETKTWKNDPTLPGKSKAGYNPLIDRGRWNCRHMIKYITDETACQTGKKEACEGEEL